MTLKSVKLLLSIGLCFVLRKSYAETCGEDYSGISDSLRNACCSEECGVCGSEDCDSLFVGSAAKCCIDKILASEIPCGKPPCIIPLSVALKCGDDNTGVLNDAGTVCCDGKCETCGGEYCDAHFLGSADSCCEEQIIEANIKCGNPPCVYKKPVEIIRNTPNCEYEEDFCGGLYRPTNDGEVIELSPPTMCCSLSTGMTCKAAPMLKNGTFKSVCVKYSYCKGGVQSCGHEQYAETPFGRTEDPECCAKGTECLANPENKYGKTSCVKPLKCSEPGEVPCGRFSLGGIDTPNDQCCSGKQGCYLIDLNGGMDYKTKCSTCAEPCGRHTLDATEGDNRCCHPKQKCQEAFHSYLPSVSTICKYPFPCSPKLCLNGGRCVEEDFPYAGQFKRCACRWGFTGPFCGDDSKH